MSNYEVTLNFNDGTHDYDFPLVQSVSDPEEGMKATVLEGTRGDGSIVIPGGKKSQTIEVNGILVEDDEGYKDITEKMNTLKTNITTDPATLTLKHKEGASWVTDWSYTVRRIEQIEFTNSLRIYKQEYRVQFLVLSY